MPNNIDGKISGYELNDNYNLLSDYNIIMPWFAFEEIKVYVRKPTDSV